MKRLIWIAAALLILTGISCDETPISDTVNSQLEYFVGDTGSKDRLIAEIGEEDERIDAAFSTLEDTDVSDALIAAHDRGVTVQIVGDVDNAGSAGLAALTDAGVPVVYLSGEFDYLPDPNLSPVVDGGAMTRPGEMNQMSHNFVILGDVTVWHFASPFLTSRTPEIGYRVVSEYLNEDFSREFRQLYAGVNATELDIYNGPTKSSVHKHPYENLRGQPFFYSDSLYTDQGRLKLLFNPQNRAVKSLIDELYRAKASIYIQTDSIDEPFVLDALEYKQAAGFDVQIVVNSNVQIDDEQQRTRLAGLGAREIDVPYLPTVVVLDDAADRFSQLRPRQAMVISHRILRTSPFAVEFNPQGDDEVLIFASDYFADGHAWAAVEVNGQRGELAVIDALLGVFNRNFEAGSQL